LAGDDIGVLLGAGEDQRALDRCPAQQSGQQRDFEVRGHGVDQLVESFRRPSVLDLDPGRGFHEAVGESLNGGRHRRREKHRLPLLGHPAHDRLDVGRGPIEHSVGLVQDGDFDGVEAQAAARR
jgi:hypothetical protein